jgi:hypothetical protein
MSLSWSLTLLVLYYLTLGVLALYGIHRSWLVVTYLRHRRDRPALPAPPAEWPVVTVQLPLYNEMYVATRLLDAVCRLSYPRDRLEIQVLDDSTDETSELVAAEVARWRERGVDVRHVRRGDRAGFKAGALDAGLACARGELLAVFDADFVPGPDFLEKTVPYFTDPADPQGGSRLGMVQARWEHINRGYSLLTRIQAILLDGHFVIEHTARNRSGRFFNFNGTAGIWRRQAIEDAGGWQHDTLTEDLDLSYRAQLAGWRFVYLPEVTVPSELPVDVRGFKSQQHRWAKRLDPDRQEAPAAHPAFAPPLAGQARGAGAPDQQRQLPADGAAQPPGLPGDGGAERRRAPHGAAGRPPPVHGRHRLGPGLLRRQPGGGGAPLAARGPLSARDDGAGDRPVAQQRTGGAVRAGQAGRRLPPHAQVPDRAQGGGVGRQALPRVGRPGGGTRGGVRALSGRRPGCSPGRPACGSRCRSSTSSSTATPTCCCCTWRRGASAGSPVGAPGRRTADKRAAAASGRLH